MSTAQGEAVDPLEAEYDQYLPVYYFAPDLSAQEVERFVALGQEGWKRHRLGDVTGAEAAFREQSTIFPPNPEPFVSLSLLEAARGSKKTAMEHLRAAVARGFTDLWRVERSEAWTQLRGTPAYVRLVDAVPRLVEIENEWPGWSAFYSERAPEDLESVLDRHDRALARVDEMAPALGARHTRLWKKLIERVTACHLETYVARKNDAPDLRETIDRLMTLYSGGPLLRWGKLPDEAAARMGEISKLALERFPNSPVRPTALVGVAVGSDLERDKRGRIEPEAVKKIREALGEVVHRYPDSPLAATAAVGLVRTELNAGHRDRAAAHFRRFLHGRVPDDALQARVRTELGQLALELGGLPPFEAIALDGKTVAAEALRGKVVVLDFWATWCGPCLDELPTLQRIRKRHGEDVTLVGVNLDSSEDLAADDLREWVASRNVPGSQIHDGMGWSSALVETFGVREIPFNVVVGPDGAVLAINEHGKKLEKTVTAALAGSAR